MGSLHEYLANLPKKETELHHTLTHTETENVTHAINTTTTTTICGETRQNWHEPVKPTHQKHQIERVHNVSDEFDAETTGIVGFHRVARHFSLRLLIPLLICWKLLTLNALVAIIGRVLRLAHPHLMSM